MTAITKANTVFHGNARDPLPAAPEGYAWVLREGAADLFLISPRHDGEGRLRDMVCTVNPGALLLQDPGALIQTDILLLSHSWAELVELSGLGESDWQDGLLQWWGPMASALGELGVDRPQITHFAEEILEDPAKDRIIPAQSTLSVRSGFTWVKAAGPLHPFGIARPDAPSALAALVPNSWCVSETDGVIDTLTCLDLWEQGQLQDAVADMNRLLSQRIRDMHLQLRLENELRLRDRHDQEQETFEHLVTAAVQSLEGRRITPKDQKSGTPLVQACARVARWSKVDFSDTAPEPQFGSSDLRVQHLAMSYRFQVRRVMLKHDWWREDCPAILAFDRSTGAPLALIPDDRHRLILFTDQSAEGQLVDERQAARLADHGFTFHPPFPEAAKSLADVGRFFLAQNPALHHLALLVLATSLLGVLPPLVMKVLFGSAISSGDFPLVLDLSIALVLIQGTSIVITLSYEAALVRMEGKALALLQTALFDRVLRVSAGFLQKMPLGKIHSKWMIFEKLHGSAICRLFITTTLTATLSIFSLVIMLYFFPLTAALVLALTVIVVFVAFKTGPRQLQAMSKGSFLDGHYWSVVTEALRGIRKLRLSGAEGRVFNRWFGFLVERRLRFQQGLRPRNRLNIILAVYEGVTLLVILVVFSLTFEVHALPMGHFMAFLAATKTFTHAVALFAAALPDFHLALTDDLPDTVTFLAGDVENPAQRKNPGRLQGGVELSKLSFRYAGATKMALDGLNIEARPGEFVALTGPSGCGKSTILKLLLGMEQPNQGAVFYDARNLNQMDVIAVRSQIGVVMQNSSLIPGTIFDYIAGGRHLSLWQAWEAARLAGVEDVIAKLPMGMFTIISENGATLSGGEMQRLMIARAISSKPKILLFDEATSWLDNHTQQKIVDALSRLRITRIIIAHRLSTLQLADRIHVLDQGKVVESGTFDELRDQNGLFSDLIRRQLS